MPTDSPRHALRDRLLRAMAGVLRPLLRLGQPRRVAVRRVLLIRPDHLGDLLFATPALERWRRHVPADIETVCSIGPWNTDLAAHGPLAGQVAAFAYPGFTRQAKGRPWTPYLTLLRQALALRRQRFDLAVILRFDHWWGGLLTFLGGVPLRVGYATEPLGAFLTDPLPYAGVAHEVERNLALIDRALAFCGQPHTPTDQFPALVYTIEPAEEQEAARLLVTLNASPERPLIALHPGAGAPVKFWPAERFAALADALARAYDATILITGGPQETPLAWQVAALARTDVQVLAGKTALPTLAALLARCDLVIGADSGPLHLAVAVGAPSIHLYGPIDPAMFGPWSDQPALHRVLMADCACAPCNRLEYPAEELPAHPCMLSISVERVFSSAAAMLDAWHFRRRVVQST